MIEIINKDGWLINCITVLVLISKRLLNGCITVEKWSVENWSPLFIVFIAVANSSANCINLIKFLFWFVVCGGAG